MAISANIGYYPPIPGADQNAAAAYFQQNPQMQNSGIGQAIYGGGASAAQIGSGLGGGMGGAGSGLGFNIGTAQLGLGAIGTIGNLWAAWQAQKLAKEQFGFQKDMTNANFANQIKTYNTTLLDRSVSRGIMQGDDAAKTEQYIDDNSLRDERKNR